MFESQINNIDSRDNARLNEKILRDEDPYCKFREPEPDMNSDIFGNPITCSELGKI